MWKPIHIQNLFDSGGKLTKASVIFLATWSILIMVLTYLSVIYLPSDWLNTFTSGNQIMLFFALNPPMIVGLIILFWFGFEWAFIPVFTSLFTVGIYSSLPPLWAFFFAMAFVFVLAIFALIYFSLKTRYDLHGISSLSIFVCAAFVGSTTSSLGAFIWSFVNELSANETLIIWNGWWAGSFLQYFLFLGPILYIFSAKAEKVKATYFTVNEPKAVNILWLYTAVIVITFVISIFIYSGDYLAQKQIYNDLVNKSSVTSNSLLESFNIFRILSWVSIGIIFSIGLGAIYVINTWNSDLRSQVSQQSKDLGLTEENLQSSLEEKVVLLQEIHHRVKNNLALVIALLDLQGMRTSNEANQELIRDSKSRIKSMALVHEILYSTNHFGEINLGTYLKKLWEATNSSYSTKDLIIDLDLNAEEIFLDLNKAIPVGLITSEVFVNAYKYAFKNRASGKIKIKLSSNLDSIDLLINDNGLGTNVLEKDRVQYEGLGTTIIKTLSRQLQGEVEYIFTPEGASFKLKIPKN